MSRLTFAIYTVLAGLLLGWVGNFLFFEKLIGLSFPLFIGLSVLVVLASARMARVEPLPRNLIPLLPMAFFALMVAWRADPLITLLNVLAVLFLGALGLHYLPLRQPFDRDALADHGAGIGEATVGVLLSPFGALTDSVRWLGERRLQDRGPLVSIGRGLLLALPVVIVFAVLLSAADTMFATLIDDTFNLFLPQNVDEMFMQGTFALMLGWLACGGIAYGVGRVLHKEQEKPTAKPADPQPETPVAETSASVPSLDELAGIAVSPAGVAAIPLNAASAVSTSKPVRRQKKRALTLGMIESSMIIGSVDLLFGAFVAIQFTYFFGGDAARELRGLTYAEYARRGFFELITVSILTLGLVLLLDWITVRHNQRQTRVFRGLATVLVGLVGVMLVSAFQRMWLYEGAFGFTQLRVYTHVFIAWLGVLFAFFLLALYRVREQIFSLGVLFVIVGYGMTLNLMNVELYMAERNVERYRAGQELDIAYLYTFSVDAAPVMLDLYRNGQDEDIRTAAGQWLAWRLLELDRIYTDGNPSVFSAHRSRDTAWALLDGARAELPEFDRSFYIPGAYERGLEDF